MRDFFVQLSPYLRDDTPPEIRDRVSGIIGQTTDDKRAIEIAREQADDDLEIDDDPMTSPSDEEGIWVAAWTHVSRTELENGK